MKYTKTIWENSPSENTPLSAENLNNIENGIDDVDTRLTTAEVEISAMCGVINMWPTNTAPNGYLLCDGSAVSRETYANLFSVLGTSYGVGNGSTTFNLPNLKGKVPVGRDSSQTNFDKLGKTGGATTVTLNIAQIPPHNHPMILWRNQAYEQEDNSDNVATTSWDNHYLKTTTENAGGGQAHNNLQPYIVLNYIIKY